MTIYTIGHSQTRIGRFLELLGLCQMERLIASRSQPYSRWAAQFSREPLKASLQQAHMAYVYGGDALGDRPHDPAYKLPNGKVDDERLAQAPMSLRDLQRLKQEAQERRIAVMCSAADYRQCHRNGLMSRALVADGVDVQHIWHAGEWALTPPHAFAAAVDQLRLFSDRSTAPTGVASRASSIDADRQ
jgi:uncharacterized protein (DUF488 family)